MARKNFKFIAKIFSYHDLFGAAGVIMALLAVLFEKIIVNDKALFAVTIIGAAFVLIVLMRILESFFMWASRQFNYIGIKLYHDSSRLISLDIKNDYDDDINDFKITLHRASMFGLPVDLIVPDNGSEFNVTDSVENGRVIARQHVKVYIAKIPPGNGNHIYTKLMIKDGLMNDAMYKMNNEDRVAVYEIIFEVTGKVQDELISRWYRARFRYRLTEKDGEQDYSSLKWMGLKKYSKSEHENRNRMVYSQPIKRKLFNENIFADLYDMEKEYHQ